MTGLASRRDALIAWFVDLDDGLRSLSSSRFGAGDPARNADEVLAVLAAEPSYREVPARPAHDTNPYGHCGGAGRMSDAEPRITDAWLERAETQMVSGDLSGMFVNRDDVLALVRECRRLRADVLLVTNRNELVPWQALIDDIHRELDQGHMKAFEIVERHRPVINAVISANASVAIAEQRNGLQRDLDEAMALIRKWEAEP